MFMKNDGDKKLSEITEQIIDIVCLAASFGILFLLPHKIDFFFYLIFGISAFLFCVGFFRLGFTIKVPAVSGWTLFTGIFFAVSGVIINIVGLYEIWRDHGSGRSITIATLLLIEALLFFAIAGGSAKTLGAKRMAGRPFRDRFCNLEGLTRVFRAHRNNAPDRSYLSVENGKRQQSLQYADSRNTGSAGHADSD